jgi:hypothetical protein
MGGHEARTYWEDRGLLLLWIAALAGPAAWTFNQLVGYALVKPSCAGGSSLLLTLIAAAALAVTVGGTWIGWSCLARLRGATETGGRIEDRSYFLAVAGIALNALIGLLIVTAAVATFVLSPCE